MNSSLTRIPSVIEDPNWECSSKLQRELIELHSADKKKWQRDICAMICAHPSKFSILDVGRTDDGDHLYAFEEFASHFQRHRGSIDNPELLRLIFDDMDSIDGTHIKFLAIHRWMNGVKAAKQTDVAKDHNWLFAKLRHVQIAHLRDLDSNGSGQVDRDEFCAHFVTKEGLDKALACKIFDDIDVNRDGGLSVMEFAKWKSKHNKAKKLRKFFKDAPATPNSRSSKGEKSKARASPRTVAMIHERQATVEGGSGDHTDQTKSRMSDQDDDAGEEMDRVQATKMCGAPSMPSTSGGVSATAPLASAASLQFIDEPNGDQQGAADSRGPQRESTVAGRGDSVAAAKDASHSEMITNTNMTNQEVQVLDVTITRPAETEESKGKDDAKSSSGFMWFALLAAVVVAGLVYRRRLKQLARKTPSKALSAWVDL